MRKYISVKEYADSIPVSRQRVVKVINDGRLPCIRIGRSYAIKEGTVWPISHIEEVIEVKPEPKALI